MRKRYIILRAVTALCCFIFAMLPTVVNVHGQSDVPATTMKDLQQDEHLHYDDTRLNDLDSTISQNKQAVENAIATRDQRIAVLEAKIDDVQTQTDAIKYFGMGAFMVLGILQTLGLLRTLRLPMQQTEKTATKEVTK